MTTHDDTPIDYLLFTQYKQNLTCSKILYMWNTFAVLSQVVEQTMFPVNDIWKAYKMEVWWLIFCTITILVIYDLIRRGRACSIATQFKMMISSLLNYTKPMLGIAEGLKYKDYVYMTWVILCIPFFIILSNDLLTNMVAKRKTFIDSLDDLLEQNVQVFGNDYIARTLKFEIPLTLEEERREKLVKLGHKIREYDHEKDYLMGLLDEPGTLVEKLQDSCMILGDESAESLMKYLSRITKMHQAEGLVQKMITPFCYTKEKFVFGHLADNV